MCRNYNNDKLWIPMDCRNGIGSNNMQSILDKWDTESNTTAKLPLKTGTAMHNQPMTSKREIWVAITLTSPKEKVSHLVYGSSEQAPKITNDKLKRIVEEAIELQQKAMGSGTIVSPNNDSMNFRTTQVKAYIKRQEVV